MENTILASEMGPIVSSIARLHGMTSKIIKDQTVETRNNILGICNHRAIFYAILLWVHGEQVACVNYVEAQQIQNTATVQVLRRKLCLLSNFHLAPKGGVRATLRTHWDRSLLSPGYKVDGDGEGTSTLAKHTAETLPVSMSFLVWWWKGNGGFPKGVWLQPILINSRKNASKGWLQTRATCYLRLWICQGTANALVIVFPCEQNRLTSSVLLKKWNSPFVKPVLSSSTWQLKSFVYIPAVTALWAMAAGMLGPGDQFLSQATLWYCLGISSSHYSPDSGIPQVQQHDHAPYICTLYGFRTYHTKLKSFEFKLQVGLDQVKHEMQHALKLQRKNTSTPITRFGKASSLIDYSKNPLPNIPEIESAYNSRARKQPTSAGYQVTWGLTMCHVQPLALGGLWVFAGDRRHSNNRVKKCGSWKLTNATILICLAC